MAKLAISVVDQYGSVPPFTAASAAGDSVSLEESGAYVLAIRNATNAVREVSFKSKHGSGYNIVFKVPALSTFCIALSTRMLGKNIRFNYNTNAGLSVAVVRTLVR